jgi:parallel beta-helix repeat protein
MITDSHSTFGCSKSMQLITLVLAGLLSVIVFDSTIVTGRSTSAINQNANCVTYDSSSSTISLNCNSTFNFIGINNALHQPHLLIQESPKVWFLNANLTVTNGAKLYIKSSDTSWLKINSTNGVACRLEVRDGDLVIDSVKITSWDSSKKDYARTTSDGSYPRSYIIATDGNGKSMTNITNSEIAYLGYHGSFGLSYSGGAGSIIKNNRIHHLWYGFYSQAGNSHDMRIEDNKFYDNNVYGIDPHSETHNLIIKNNKVYNNGRHGIICATGCYNIIIESNKVFNNSQNGIMLYDNASNSIIRNNTVYNNTEDQISVYGSDNNQLYGNNVTNGKTGIRLSDLSAHNNIHNNNITNPSQNAIYLLRGASMNTITANTISNASGYALFIQDPNTNNNIIKANHLLDTKPNNAFRVYNPGYSHSTIADNVVSLKKTAILPKNAMSMKNKSAMSKVNNCISAAKVMFGKCS